MATSYEKTTDLDTRIAKAIEQWHPDLAEAGVTFNVLFAAADEGPAIKIKGYPAIATIKVNGVKDRASGVEDVTLIVDQHRWNELQEAERVAVIDHELTHLEVKRKKKGGEPVGAIKRDDLGRPQLGTVPHDFEIGAFKEVIERHKQAAVEAQAVADASKWMQGVVMAWG